MNTVKILKLDENAILPTKGSAFAACFDLYALDDCFFFVGGLGKVRTGLAVEVPEGYYLEIVPRSGLSMTGLRLVNSPATVDSDYRGEVFILMQNHSEFTTSVQAGQRVAQCRLHKVEEVEFEIVNELSDTERGEGGLGSTGL